MQSSNIDTNVRETSTKRFLGLAMSIVVVMILTSNGSAGNLSKYALSSAGHPKEIERLFAGWNSHDPDKVAAALLRTASMRT